MRSVRWHHRYADGPRAPRFERHAEGAAANRPARGALLLCALLSACGSVVAGVGGDAATGADAALAPSRHCTWRAGEVRAVTSHWEFRLHDVAIVRDEAWVLFGFVPGFPGDCCRPDDPLFISRLDFFANHRERVQILPQGAQRYVDTVFLAVDDASDRRAVLVGPDFTPFGPAATPLDLSPRTRLYDGGTAARLHRPVANRSGFTVIADGLRPADGVSLMQLDPAGGIVSTRDLRAPAGFDARRVMLPDGGFLLTWTTPVTMTEAELHVRAYDEDGAPRSPDAYTIDRRASTRPRLIAVPTRDGLLALWETTAHGASPTTLMAQRLSREGRPDGAPRLPSVEGTYVGALHAAATHGDVLVTAMVWSGERRFQALVLDEHGASRAPPVVLARGERLLVLHEAHIVATPPGALVAFKSDHEGVRAVALTCEGQSTGP